MYSKAKLYEVFVNFHTGSCLFLTHAAGQVQLGEESSRAGKTVFDTCGTFVHEDCSEHILVNKASSLWPPRTFHSIMFMRTLYCF